MKNLFVGVLWALFIFFGFIAPGLLALALFTKNTTNDYVFSSEVPQMPEYSVLCFAASFIIFWAIMFINRKEL